MLGELIYSDYIQDYAIYFFNIYTRTVSQPQDCWYWILTMTTSKITLKWLVSHQVPITMILSQVNTGKNGFTADVIARKIQIYHRYTTLLYILAPGTHYCATNKYIR